MASVVRIRYVPKSGFAPKIMNGAGCVSLIGSKGEMVKGRADSMGSATYETNCQPGKNRCHAIVYTPDLHAIRSNAKHNSLLSALG